MAEGVALGASKIAKLQELNDEAMNIIKNDIADQYNTFQYVVKNLSSWADETAVGSELRNKMQKTVEEVFRLMNGSSNLHHSLEELIELQGKINNSLE